MIVAVLEAVPQLANVRVMVYLVPGVSATVAGLVPDAPEPALTVSVVALEAMVMLPKLAELDRISISRCTPPDGADGIDTSNRCAPDADTESDQATNWVAVALNSYDKASDRGDVAE